GAGLDMLAYVIAVEQIARACGSTAITLAAHVSLGCGPVYENGTEEQKLKFLVPMAKGEAIGAFGLTESGAGSDAAGTQTRAERRFLGVHAHAHRRANLDRRAGPGTRAGRVREERRVREGAAAVRQTDRELPGRAVHAGRHGDAHRGRAAPRLSRRDAEGRGA